LVDIREDKIACLDEAHVLVEAIEAPIRFRFGDRMNPPAISYFPVGSPNRTTSHQLSVQPID
jgi:hypothetical protein